jgi:hypothetical protein
MFVDVVAFLGVLQCSVQFFSNKFPSQTNCFSFLALSQKRYYCAMVNNRHKSGYFRFSIILPINRIRYHEIKDALRLNGVFTFFHIVNEEGDHMFKASVVYEHKVKFNHYSFTRLVSGFQVVFQFISAGQNTVIIQPHVDLLEALTVDDAVAVEVNSVAVEVDAVAVEINAVAVEVDAVAVEVDALFFGNTSFTNRREMLLYVCNHDFSQKQLRSIVDMYTEKFVIVICVGECLLLEECVFIPFHAHSSINIALAAVFLESPN